MISITYLYNDEDDKKLLFKDGEIPAKSEDEADAVCTPEDSIFDTIVSAIPMFRDAEAGAEETVTHSPEEFLDMYNLDIELLEDEVGADLDGDHEVEEAHEGLKPGLEDAPGASNRSGDGQTAPENWADRGTVYTDPLAGIKAARDEAKYTNPDDAMWK